MEADPGATAPKSTPWARDTTAQTLLRVLHYAYPIVLLCFFLAALTTRSIRHSKAKTPNSVSSEPKTGPGGKPLPQRPSSNHSHDQDNDEAISRPRKLLFTWLSVANAATFLANAVNIFLHVVVDRSESWWCGQAVAIYIVGSFFVYLILLISLVDSKSAPSPVHLYTWILGWSMEVMLLGASYALYLHSHQQPRIGHDGRGNIVPTITQWEIAETIIDVLRILILTILVGVYWVFLAVGKSKKNLEEHSSDEAASLLSHEHQSNGAAVGGYGGTHHGPANGHAAPPAADAPGWVKPANPPARSWWEYIKSYSLFFPYIWPSKDKRLQIVVVLCFLIVLLQRVVNLLVPNQVGIITDELSGENGPIRMPWGAICLYIVLRLLQGGNGLLGAVRSVMWIPVGQYSYRELAVASFEHVHSLSLDFHLGKRIGEVISALNKGNSINQFLEQVTFSVVPMIVDLFVAAGYFLVKFDAYYALVLTVVTFFYVYITIRMAQWRVEVRRDMVNADREEEAVKNDSLVSYETVKYFNAETYEFNRYRDAVKKLQKAEYKVTFSLNVLNISQNMIFMVGLMVCCFIAAYQVSSGQVKVGRFVSLLTYFAQLQQPLNFFGTFYRTIQTSMINSERMLELFKEKATVIDKPDAEELPNCTGDIVFKDVHFSYDDRKPALTGLDFRCPPGTTTALVGESGGGKSTVFRLLFRFYNIASGRIMVDDHDVDDITIDSLRRHIGVVPQDTVLFNESLMYNLKYARPDATDEEVYEACRAASIHDKIMTFPDQYDTKVGERGLRLSGGEKQRVAIARTILKDPRIILLDEATAALDTETEEHIQDALIKLARGRTTLVIAHRLSTITMADQILVLHEGKVSERGTHDELLNRKGRYASMWRKQVRAQKAAEGAARLKDKAERLRRESRDAIQVGALSEGASGSNSSSTSEDEKDRRPSVSTSAEPSYRARRESEIRRQERPALTRLATDDSGGAKPAWHP